MALFALSNKDAYKHTIALSLLRQDTLQGIGIKKSHIGKVKHDRIGRFKIGSLRKSRSKTVSHRHTQKQA